MGSLFRAARAPRPSRSIASVDDYASLVSELQFSYAGNVYSLGNTPLGGTWAHQPVETVPINLESFAQAAYAANGVVFAVMAVRQLVFSAIRFSWQRLRQGRPSDLFGTSGLAVLEQPYPGGTTQDMLTRVIQDADLAGNSYWVRSGVELVRMRPDWVEILLEPRGHDGRHLGWRKLAYFYYEGGKARGADPAIFMPDEVMHFAPSPDPLATYRGMSWLTPVLREVANDKAMGRHKSKFFENAATPNLSVALDKDISREAFATFKEKMELSHRGVDNAYKTLFLGGGADVKVIGADFQQMDFRRVQGHGETRIAAAGGVPPVIVGLSEGLEAATYSNYAQARRRFADGTMHPLWQSVAGSFATLITRAPGARLWYDARDIPFLREDRRDAAEIQGRQAQTIRSLVESGYTPETVIRAVDAEDWGLLKHSGLYSVQLQQAGAQGTPATPPAITGGTNEGESDDE